MRMFSFLDRFYDSLLCSVPCKCMLQPLHAGVDRITEKKTVTKKRKQTEGTRSAHPGKNATEKQRLFCILLTKSQWTPTLLPGIVLNSYFERFAVGQKVQIKDALNSQKYTTHPDYPPQCTVRTPTEEADQQDVVWSPSGWVCLALVCTETETEKKVYLFWRSHIPVWHFPDIRSSQ